jgi:poly-gamma-glutamate synthesis protein (capsule biosynthesis protein)
MAKRRSHPVDFALVVFLLTLGTSLFAQGVTLQLTFAGDIMMHTVNYLCPDYSAIYRSISPLLKKDDLTFANLEFPIDPARPFSGYPRFNGTPEYVGAAVEAGIDVFSLANNHAFDQGRDGVFQTLRVLSQIGERSYRRLYAGGTRGNLKAPFQPVEIHCRGIRIGFLAVCQMTNVSMPDSYVNVVDYRNPYQRESFLREVERVCQSYDLFILSYHGGREYARKPEEERIDFFRRLVEAGVDVVWGHHPHIPQSHRLVERQEGTGLIMPSTGNLISGMLIGLKPEHPEHELAWTVDSSVWLVSVRVERERASVERVIALPIVNYRNIRGEILVERTHALDGTAMPEQWRGFYRHRARLQRDFLR